MAGINKAIIVGNLGQDPEVRYTKSGQAICNFTVATSEKWNDKESGNEQVKVEWHKIVMYRRLAEIAGEYLKKGSKVYIEGKLQTRKWMDEKVGVERYTTEIVANEMQMLDGKQTADKSTYSKEDYKPEGSAQSVDTNFDDDIPF